MPRLTAAQTRHALLAAGRRLIERRALSALTARAVSAEAGVPQAAFGKQFQTATQFQCELMRLMLDEVRDSVTKLTSAMPPGLPRLKLAIEGYLAGNLQRAKLRALMQQLRRDPMGADLVRRRVQGFTLMLELELKSLKWPRPAATARLLTAALVDILIAEHVAGKALPDLRQAIFSYLDSRGP